MVTAEWNSGEWRCSICGRYNEGDFKFCPECGEKKPDHEETWEEISIKKLKRAGYENCEQEYKFLVHIEDEEGTPLGSYNVTLHGYDTEKELKDLLEDYLGYKKGGYRGYYLKVLEWPHNPGPSEWWSGSSLHVCEMEAREFRIIRKKYQNDRGPVPCLYGCPNSRDIEEMEPLQMKVEILYYD